NWVEYSRFYGSSEHPIGKFFFIGRKLNWLSDVFFIINEIIPSLIVAMTHIQSSYTELLRFDDCSWHIAKNIIAYSSFSLIYLVLFIKPFNYLVAIICALSVFVIDHRSPFGKRAIVFPIP